MPLILNLMCLGALASACTTVLVNTTSGVAVVGRTMELGSMDLPTDVTNTKMWRMMTIPRGGGIGQVRADGFHSSVYGFAGIGFWAPEPAEVEGVMGEGMNEKGLTVSALSFNSQGAYEAPGSGKPALACVDVVPYLLGSAKTAAEAVALLRGVAVVDDAHLTPLVGRFHWAVQDAAGAMVVLEYVGGALHVHDAARVGVLTNDPEYEWHLKNLNQYALYSLDRVQEPDGPLRPFGHGLNTVGLPGSYSPPDRFAKMFLLREAAVRNAPPATTTDAVVLAAGLLNTVHIVMGTVANTEHEDAGGLEWTEWSVVKVPAERKFYVRTYSAQGWREVDLARMDHSVETAPVPLYRGLDVRPFEFGAAAATAEL